THEKLGHGVLRGGMYGSEDIQEAGGMLLSGHHHQSQSVSGGYLGHSGGTRARAT
ncbi:hypothetical protein Pcinc_030652, partial [Petrolisthes cinctipes]